VTSDALALQGQEVFLSSGCMNCHTIRGTQATGELGPDLTHFASRLTLGSGTAANTRGNLGGWIADPHSLKPGNLMPPTALSGEDLNALLAYLETLE
jgi:cytochrome c oxidase subunit 2